MNYKITVIPGDGIGPEIIDQGVKVLKAVARKYGHDFIMENALMGGAAYDATGDPLPQATLDLCNASDAVYLGAVGGPKWDDLPEGKRPENGLLGIRKALNLYANIRPAMLFKPLANASTLKKEVIGDDLDMIVVRELTGGAYFGKKEKHADYAYDTIYYTADEIRRVAKIGFELAMKRKKKLTSVDKANVLLSSRLWREVVLDVAKEYPEVELDHYYVDNCAMQFIRNPRQFDVIVTENMFGDILSDEAAMLTGSIGMLPSCSMGDKGAVALYEPIHGSAPKYAGQNVANPLATIMSAAMMLRYSFDLDIEASSIEAAVLNVLESGSRTKDIMEDGLTQLGTSEMGDAVCQRIR